MRAAAVTAAVALLVGPAVDLVAARPARAGVGCIRDTCWADDIVKIPGKPGGGGGGGGGDGSGVTCTYRARKPGKYPLRPAPPGYRWYVRTCRHPSGHTTQDAVLVKERSRGTPPATLAGRARERITVPAPRIHMNPPVRWEQITQFETWLWVGKRTWRPVTKRASAGRNWAEATATPVRVEWSMGDGASVVCAGRGTRYRKRRPPEAQATDCSHTYTVSSAGQPGDRFPVRATVTWEVTWRGSDGSSGTLPQLRSTASVAVRVAEIQAVNT